MKTLLTPTPLIACETKHLNVLLSELPKGEYTVLGEVAEGVIDFEVTGIPHLHPHMDFFFMDYTDANKWCVTQKESFMSLLKKHSLSLDKKYLIIKPKN